MSASPKALQAAFFDYIYREDKGYVCISTRKGNDNDTWRETYFEWPKQKQDLLAYVTKVEKSLHVWFGVHLYVTNKRNGENCLPVRHVYADLDTCSPDTVTPPPQCVIESSPGRFQAFWRLEDLMDADEAAEFSRRIAHGYSSAGVDRGGWDKSQLLRVPFTTNFKYEDLPRVELLKADTDFTDISAFDALPEAPPQEGEPPKIPMPELELLPEIVQLLFQYQQPLSQKGFDDVFFTEPDEDWSKPLWRLINICFEVGMDREQALAVAMQAKCNKYARDNRPVSHLWKEILRAEQKQEAIVAFTNEADQYKPIVLPILVTAAEEELLPKTIIDDYREWGAAVTDAPPQFHDLSAFIALSSLTASGIVIPTHYNPEMFPNLWGLVLGESSLSRKSTTMTAPMRRFVWSVDPDILIANEGSPEGILTGISQRPNMVSMMFRDEVHGLFSQFKRKDYLSGFPEMLAALYDVPSAYTRVLRKEKFQLSYPVFVFYGGGIQNQVYAMLNKEHVASGFIPRFLVVAGKTDVANLRPTGPPTKKQITSEAKLYERFVNLYQTYNRQGTISIPGSTTAINERVYAELTDAAWERFQHIENQLVRSAHESTVEGAEPCFTRQAISLLKMAALLAATRQEPDENKITVEVADVLSAASYIQAWLPHIVDLIIKCGLNTDERDIERIVAALKGRPEQSVMRSELTRNYKISAKLMDDYERTLIDRGQLLVSKVGHAKKYTLVG